MWRGLLCGVSLRRKQWNIRLLCLSNRAGIAIVTYLTIHPFQWVKYTTSVRFVDGANLLWCYIYCMPIFFALIWIIPCSLTKSVILFSYRHHLTPLTQFIRAAQTHPFPPYSILAGDKLISRSWSSQNYEDPSLRCHDTTSPLYIMIHNVLRKITYHIDRLIIFYILSLLLFSILFCFWCRNLFLFFNVFLLVISNILINSRWMFCI